MSAFNFDGFDDLVGPGESASTPNDYIEAEDGDNMEDLDEVFPIHDDRGLSTEEWDEMMAEDNSSHKWKEVCNEKQARFTLGVGYDLSWGQAKKEMIYFRDKLQEKIADRQPKDIGPLVELIFGKESELYRSFKDEGIFDSNETYLNFIQAFLMSCAYQVSCKQLFDKYSRICLGGAMQQAEYIACWKRIGNASLPPSLERNKEVTPTGAYPFWLKLEEAFNTYSRELFMNGCITPMYVTIDDDKAWVDNRKYHAGLKTVRHTKDNRNGNTCHTEVHAYAQVVVQIAWEKQVNDSSPAAARRMIHNSITPMAAPGEPGDLSNVYINKDRGYWNKTVLHDYFMKGGAKIAAGTVKRQPCIPMTYDQKIDPAKDTRVDIPKAGPKTLFTMKTVSHGRDLYCLCYRNGNGGNVLGISTEYGKVPEWEGVLSNPKDMAFYESIDTLPTSDIQIKCFPLLKVDYDKNNPRDTGKEDVSGDFLDHLEELEVRSLTTTQGTPEWFMLQKYSLTSSTTDAAIAVCDGTEDFLNYADSWQTIKALLRRTRREQEEVAAEAAAAAAAATAVAADEQGEEANEAPPVIALSLPSLLASDGVAIALA